MDSPESGALILTRWLFLRGLSLVYLCAFVSLLVQISGLVGKEGVLPWSSFAATARERAGRERYWILPTLAWLNCSDWFLKLLAASGAAASLAALAGVCTMPCLAAAWLLYLSLNTVCRTFLAFQWDTLLLETGFLALFLGPWQWLEPPWTAAARSTMAEPSLVVVWLLRWLVFRLMFSSGAAKLASGDPTWRDLTAMQFHYWTQPLPTPLAWYTAQLPLWFHKLSTASVFALELALPFLIFGPLEMRAAAAAGIVILQLLIAATGNYTFFNLLTVVLCIPLLDDSLLRAALPHKAVAWMLPATVTPAADWLWFAPLALLLAPATGFMVAEILKPGLGAPGPVQHLMLLLSRFHIANEYGLFAVMTTNRPEIIIQGSNDGNEWLDYEFKFKPGDPRRAPPWVAPHQPRLDWQMWFAAQEMYVSNPWLVNLCVRLLQGSRSVIGLLAGNPFPDNPPRYVRAVLFDYEFTDAAERKESGCWWRRELLGTYLPAIELQPDKTEEEDRAAGGPDDSPA